MPQSRIVQHLQAMVKLMEGHEGISARFPSVSHYLLANGRTFESAPLSAEELAWTAQLGWRRHQPRQCYRNAQVTALTVLPPDGMSLHYVEGFIMPAGPPIPVEHAWLSLNGKVIDTTLRPNDDKGCRVFGTIPEGWEYYGVEMPVDVCQHVPDRHKRHISLIDDIECRWPLLKETGWE